MKLKTVIVALFLFFCFSCRTEEKDIRPVYPEDSSESVNHWVKQQMDKYYYWNTRMPKNPDYSLSTPEFMKSLLVPDDRFSVIVNPQDPATYPRSVRGLYGFDYAVLQTDHKVITVIKVVLDNSPAFNVGLKRGMIITKINGTALNASNTESIMSSLSAQSSFDLTVGEWQNGTMINEKDITIYYGFTFEQPLQSVIIEREDKKVAYLYIPDFREGTSDVLIRKFAEFKAAGVQDLILDLRYNYGGSVAAAAALCAMIPSGITANSPFIKYIGNKNGGTIVKTFAEQVAFDTSAPPFSTFQANTLSLGKVFILTSNNTTSASEIVINNLRPYMEVVQIGTGTAGKDMAGFPIIDESNPKKIPWEIHPMIYKVYNAKDQGDYAKGLIPQFEVSEYSVLPLLPLGNPQEALLSVALNKIFSHTSKRSAFNSSHIRVISESYSHHGIEVYRKKGLIHHGGRSNF